MEKSEIFINDHYTLVNKFGFEIIGIVQGQQLMSIQPTINALYFVAIVNPNQKTLT